MKNRAFTAAALGLALAGASTTASATVFDIYQLSAFITSTEIAPIATANAPPNLALQDDRVLATASDKPLPAGPFSEFGLAGLGVSFTDNLTDGLGNAKWRIDNNSGGDLTNVKLIIFLDMDIDNPPTPYFNELATNEGFGANPEDPDSWEIDEPGFLFGDIVPHLLDGQLDNDDNFFSVLPDDASLAIGFEIGSLLASQSLFATANISATDIDGLRQTDADTGGQFWFNGTAFVRTVDMPEPASLLLLGLGLAGIGGVGRLRSRS